MAPLIMKLKASLSKRLNRKKRNIKKEKQSPEFQKKKSIRFHPRVRVLEVESRHSLTKEEILACWFTIDEMQKMQQTDELDGAFSVSSSSSSFVSFSPTATNNPNNNQHHHHYNNKQQQFVKDFVTAHHYRYFQSFGRRKCTQTIINEVLMEQSRQKCIKINDDEQLALVYRNAVGSFQMNRLSHIMDSVSIHTDSSQSLTDNTMKTDSSNDDMTNNTTSTTTSSSSSSSFASRNIAQQQQQNQPTTANEIHPFDFCLANVMRGSTELSSTSLGDLRITNNNNNNKNNNNIIITAKSPTKSTNRKGLLLFKPSRIMKKIREFQQQQKTTTKKRNS